MLTELNGKGGCLCESARNGSLRCPLIVRPTSEDVITGHLFGSLKVVNPRWWLPDFLNRALGTERFRRQVYRNLQIELWQKQPRYPSQYLPWDEGQTEVDVVITWENPATTVFIEMKYGSPLSRRTVHNSGTSGYPADQLIRNARVGLWQCGWLSEDLLFNQPRRDFVLILVTPAGGHPLVTEYRDPERLRSAIPHRERLKKLPPLPFLGELSYTDLSSLLTRHSRWFSAAERRLIDILNGYLRGKLMALESSDAHERAVQPEPSQAGRSIVDGYARSADGGEIH